MHRAPMALFVALLLHVSIGWRLVPAIAAWPWPLALIVATLVASWVSTPMTLLARRHRRRTLGDALALSGAWLAALRSRRGTFFVTGKHESPSDPHAAIAGADAAAAVRLPLAHQPRSAAEAQRAGWHLQISGRTNGGQFLPWNGSSGCSSRSRPGCAGFTTCGSTSAAAPAAGGRRNGAARLRRSRGCGSSAGAEVASGGRKDAGPGASRRRAPWGA